MLAGVTPTQIAEWLATVGGIILVDLALSGDNALIIGAAASRLPRRQQTIALAWGGAGAILLRILLTTVAARLLLLPFVQTIGAAVIMFITIRMLLPEKDGEGQGAASRASDRLGPAILTILAADASMSLDNVLAIGALSRGNIPLLIFGLALSMLLLLTASAIVARLIERFPWLMDLTALVLAYTAAGLFLRDTAVSGALGLTGGRAVAVTVGVVVFTLLTGIAIRVAHARRQGRARAQASTADTRAADEADEEDEATRAQR
ncbi:MAG TPA: YjbE family putative metal transport protein [Ktedonobacterales bacterium]